MSLAKLKKLLSECHFKKTDVVLKTMDDASYDYMIRRAFEEIKLLSIMPGHPTDDKRLILIIQLLLLARLKLQCRLSDQRKQLEQDQKQ